MSRECGAKPEAVATFQTILFESARRHKVKPRPVVVAGITNTSKAGGVTNEADASTNLAKQVDVEASYAIGETPIAKND